MIRYDMIYDICDVYDMIHYDIILYYIILYHIIYHITSHHITSHHIILYNIILHYITLYYIILYYICIFNCNWVDTRWQQYSSHLHTNSTQNTQNRTYITITKLNMPNNKN
jgi:hypothetical protein